MSHNNELELSALRVENVQLLARVAELEAERNEADRKAGQIARQWNQLQEALGEAKAQTAELQTQLERANSRVVELESEDRKTSSALQAISDCAEDFGASPISVPNMVLAENMRKKMVEIYGRLVEMYGEDAEHLGQPYGDGFDAVLAGLRGATVIPDADDGEQLDRATDPRADEMTREEQCAHDMQEHGDKSCRQCRTCCELYRKSEADAHLEVSKLQRELKAATKLRPMSEAPNQGPIWVVQECVRNCHRKWVSYSSEPSGWLPLSVAGEGSE